MLEVRDFKKAPKDVQESEDKAAERAVLFTKKRLKTLSPQQLANIEKRLDEYYIAWQKQTEPQRKRLVQYAELIEGVVQDSNVPFEGASNITLHYAAGIARSFQATFNKTAYQDEEIFYPIPSPELQQKLASQPEVLAVIEEGFNYSFGRGCNGLSTLKEGTIPCVRDGTLVVSGDWRREVRHCFDQRVYRKIEDFKKDYPDAESAGIDEEAYAEVLDFFLAHAEPAAPEEGQPAPAQDLPELVVGYEYDHVYKNEPEYRVGPWAKFVRYPLSSRAIADCLLYGYLMTESREAVKVKKKRGEYYEAGVKRALDARGNDQPDHWDRSLGFVEGITPPQEKSGKPVRYLDGCLLMDLDGDGIPEKYRVKYAYEEKVLLAMTANRLRRNTDNAIVFRMVKRENRLDGVSLIGDCQDLFTQIDIGARHENNVRILTTAPIFLAKDTLKDQIDLGRAENVTRPGCTYWVPDPNANPIKQLEVRNLDVTHDWLEEMNLYKQHVELVFGPTQGLSGQQAAGDKRAPGNKTLALLTQANGRIDAYLSEYSESGPALADLHSALLTQHAEGPELKYQNNGKLLSLPLDLLADPGMAWGMKRRSVQLTPEFAMARLSALQALYMELRPLMATEDPIAIEMWNRHVRASGEPQADKFLMSGDNLQKVQKSLQAAMAMNPQNPEVKAKSKGKEAYHKEIGKAAGHAAVAAVASRTGMTTQNGVR